MDGQLQQHFVGVGAKRISATEAVKAGVSNGHELSAGGRILDLLGRHRAEIPCTYLYFSEAWEEGGYIEDTSTVTLYDARENDPSRTPEWRLYYPAGCTPMESMGPGDYCWVAKRRAGGVVIVVADMGTPTARRLDRLFGTGIRLGEEQAPRTARQFGLFDLSDAGDEDLDLTDADLMLALGVTPSVQSPDRLSEMVSLFGGGYPFPTTAAFTAYARSVCPTEDPAEDPDRALFEWVSTTNDLYFTYERHVLQPLLDAELAEKRHIDIDTFFVLATRFKNARFSRAGSSFEHHIAALLTSAELRFSQPRRLPDGSKPDFLLPTAYSYGDQDLPPGLSDLSCGEDQHKGEVAASRHGGHSHCDQAPDYDGPRVERGRYHRHED